MANSPLPPFSKLAHTLVQGGTYQHYKGTLYHAIGLGRHSETLEECVFYRDNMGQLWARPAQMFLEEIELDGKKQPRFKLIK